MLRAVSAGAAFLLFLGGRRVSNAGMSFFSVFVRGLRAAKVCMAVLRCSFADCARKRCT